MLWTSPLAVQVPSETEKTLATAGETRELDARLLTEAFAEKGMLCSVIVPHSNPEDIKRQISKLVAVADISILDWELKGGDGSITRDAIVEIISNDNKDGGRTRLIVIYSVGDANNVMKELSEKLHDQGLILNTERLEIQGERTLIAFFQKPATLNATAEVVDYRDLPHRVVEEFARLTSGLLPAAALTAITEIRDQTHHLLASFPAALDGAFLAHRCLIPDPNDAEDFLLELIEGEIGALLSDSSVSQAVDAARCTTLLNQCKGLSPSERGKWETSLSIYQADRKIAKGDPEKLLDLVYSGDKDKSENARVKLSMLSTLSNYPNKYKKTKRTAPKLRLGTLVFGSLANDPVKPVYVLCVQPLCDSVRIKSKEDTIYPFLVLDVQDRAAKKNLDLCVPGTSGETVWLKVTSRPNKIVSINFKGKSPKEAFVEAAEAGSRYTFVASDGRQFQWLADLKLGKAQRIVSQLAARIHTPGIDEFEWMRLYESRAE
jgi:hypothetical protein